MTLGDEEEVWATTGISENNPFKMITLECVNILTVHFLTRVAPSHHEQPSHTKVEFNNSEVTREAESVTPAVGVIWPAPCHHQRELRFVMNVLGIHPWHLLLGTQPVVPLWRELRVRNQQSLGRTGTNHTQHTPTWRHPCQ